MRQVCICFLGTPVHARTYATGQTWPKKVPEIFKLGVEISIIFSFCSLYKNPCHLCCSLTGLPLALGLPVSKYVVSVKAFHPALSIIVVFKPVMLDLTKSR